MSSNERKERLSGGTEVVSLNNVSFFSYDRVLFYDVNFKIHKGRVVVLTGESGSGKSVLLRMIMGNEQPNEGDIKRKSGLTVSYVPQTVGDLGLNSNQNPSIRDFFYQARGLDLISAKKEAIERRMSTGDQSVLNQYGEVLDQYEQLGGYQADEEIEKILEGLKLSSRFSGHINPETKIRQVSSGQHTKLLIGRALFAKSDLLVLDDPTSHLDVGSVHWLAEFLKSSKQAVVVASQNTKFTEICANQVVEITDFGRTLSFEGNYTQFVTKRDNLLAAEKVAAKAAQARFDRLQKTFLDFKNKGYFKNSPEFAQVGRAMQTRLRRMEGELSGIPGTREVYRTEKVRSMKFEVSNSHLNNSISLKGLRKKYDHHEVINLPNLDLTIRRGEILLLSGENGSGKSTLLRMIADSTRKSGKFVPDKGVITVESGLRIGYYAPDQDSLPRKGNMFEELLKAMPHRNESEATSTLLFFGFPHQNIRQLTLETISVGERKQFALAKIMVQKPDVLLLDEPTDNLKPEVVERLVQALRDYSGTAIVVAHDPEFTKNLGVDFELQLPLGKVIKHRQ